MKEKYQVNITIISCGKVNLYNGYHPSKSHAPRLAKNLEDLYRELSKEPITKGKKYLKLEFCAETLAEGCDCSMPQIKYYFDQ